MPKNMLYDLARINELFLLCCLHRLICECDFFHIGDNGKEMMVIWRITGKIVVTVLHCCVYHSCARCADAHTNSSYSWVYHWWFGVVVGGLA